MPQLSKLRMARLRKPDKRREALAKIEAERKAKIKREAFIREKKLEIQREERKRLEAERIKREAEEKKRRKIEAERRRQEQIYAREMERRRRALQTFFLRKAAGQIKTGVLIGTPAGTYTYRRTGDPLTDPLTEKEVVVEEPEVVAESQKLTQQEVNKINVLVKKYEQATLSEKAKIIAHALLTPEGYVYMAHLIGERAGIEGAKPEEILAERMLKTYEKYPKGVTVRKVPEHVLEVITSPVGMTETMFFGGAAVTTATKVPAVARAISTPAGRVGLTAMEVAYAGDRGKEFVTAVKEDKPLEAIETLLKVTTEVPSAIVGARAQFKHQSMERFKKLSVKKQDAAMQELTEIAKSKAPKIRKADLSKADRIPSKKAGRVIKDYAIEKRLTLGGSGAMQTQTGKKISIHDLDFYTGGTKKSAVRHAKTLEIRLKEAGVQRVSRVGAEVTIKGKKAVEIHPAKDFLYMNIHTVEHPMMPARAYVGTDPEGLKVLRLKTQLRREVVRHYLEGGTPRHRARYQAVMKGMKKRGVRKPRRRAPIEPIIKIKEKPKLLKKPKDPIGVGVYPSYPKYPKAIPYKAPIYKKTVYKAPKYKAPTYKAPKYKSPKYKKVPYTVPKYKTVPYKKPTYKAPKYKTPVYKSPRYAAPKYKTPVYKSPRYAAPKYKTTAASRRLGAGFRLPKFATKELRKKKIGKRKYKYKPSLTGIYLREPIKKAPVKKLTGIEFRPPVERKRKKRWRF